MNPAIHNLEKRNIPPLPCWRFFRFVSLAFTIFLGIILSLYFVVDARADYELPTDTVLLYPAPSDGLNDDYFNSLPVAYSNSDGNYVVTGINSDLYFATVQTSVNAYYQLYVISTSNINYSIYSLRNGTWTYVNGSRVSDWNGTYQLYYKQTSNEIPSTPINVVPFSSVNSMLAGVRDYIDNPPSPDPPVPSPTGHNATFTLPAGNVAFVDFGSSGQNYKVEMRTTFPFNSDLFSGQFSPVSQKWGWADSLPASSGALSSAGQYVVPWYKTEPYNLLRQSKSAYVTSQTMVANGFWNETTSSRYLVINNPYFNTVSADSSGNPVLNNGNIIVSVENAVSVRVLSATDSLTSTGIQADVNPDVYYDGTFTDSGGTDFTNQDGAIASPEYGGNNYVPPAASAESLAEQIKNILNDLVSKITTIFTATHDAILTLVSAARDFFGVFGLLYAWLPAEVYAVLQSGMIVAVTIGIFKVFL